MNGHAEYESLGIGRPRLVVGIVVGFVAFAAIAMGLLYLVYRPVAYEGPLSVRTFRAPRLQIDSVKERHALDRAQRQDLENVRWRDRTAGIQTIPIDKAMDLVAARGPRAFAPLPSAATVNGETARPDGATAPEGRRSNPGSGTADPMQEGHDGMKDGSP